ncbi:MAG: hypothetical protein ACLPY1_22400 [Terracidiphilus sp.]
MLITLDFVRPFSLHANRAVVKLTLQLCPLFILGFGMHSWVSVVAFSIIGNVILYGAVFGAIAAIIPLYRRFVA